MRGGSLELRGTRWLEESEATKPREAPFGREPVRDDAVQTTEIGPGDGW